MAHPFLSGKPRVEIAPHVCKTCGVDYMRTANEIKKYVNICPSCKKIRRELSKKTKIQTSRLKQPEHRQRWEVVLPKTHTPHFCKTRKDWYMRVRTRRKNSKDPLTPDRIWLKVGENASKEKVDSAYAAAYARKEMDGCVRIPSERVKMYAKKRYRKVRDLRSWTQGKDRNLGIQKVWVRARRFKGVLPDPLREKGVITCGLHRTLEEAKTARNAKYKELLENVLPCAVCGHLPAFLRGALTHIRQDCPNITQLPTDPRKLYQVKMWNHIFRKGEHEPGVYLADQLVDMGLMYRPRGARIAYGRRDVEYNFSLRTRYVRERNADAEADEEEIGFE